MWNELNDFAKIYYPQANLKYEWATQDITSSMVAAKVLCDMMQDKKNDYAEVFSPQRNI